MGRGLPVGAVSEAPLLSVCVPTYQRASLLRVMLQALLPQAAELDGAVEVCVSDNASTDDTGDVVADAMADAPGAVVRYLCRPENVGPVRNYVLTATEMARGRFIWALGDDDLLVPGALQRVCDVLRAQPQLDAFYANFASADYDAHWPVSAHGGYAGTITSLANRCVQDRPVLHWQDLLDCESSYATQVYVHIVARRVWIEYWQGRVIAPDYRSLESTYPHTCMLIEMLWDRPAHYLGAPALVQFNGRAGWADGQGARIALVGTPELVARLDAKGIGVHALQRAREHLTQTTARAYLAALRGELGADAAGILRASGALFDRVPELTAALMSALQHAGTTIDPSLHGVVRELLAAVQAKLQATPAPAS